MMRGYQAPHGGLVLFTAPSRHQRMVRRRWLALAVILAVALAGGVIGQMSATHHDAAHPVPPGPLSYLAQ